MKILFFVSILLASQLAHAKSLLVCDLKTEGNILEEKQLSVSLDENEISFEADFFGTTKTVSGKFLRQAKNGSLMYDGSDLTEQVDQSDFGYIFVDQDLLTTGKGRISLSVRQLGDSEGFSWINDHYSCRQR
jgi:hypothetical protein